MGREVLPGALGSGLVTVVIPDISGGKVGLSGGGRREYNHAYPGSEWRRQGRSMEAGGSPLQKAKEGFALHSLI